MLQERMHEVTNSVLSSTWRLLINFPARGKKGTERGTACGLFRLLLKCNQRVRPPTSSTS